MDLLKMILDQAAGVAIAMLLIMRIETKLDGLTNAVIRLSDAIKPTEKL
ncbi:MAG: YvrJ family protein [Enterococcus sp.]|nr:YvrJ family protein [Enterococcus sp.]